MRNTIKPVLNFILFLLCSAACSAQTYSDEHFVVKSSSEIHPSFSKFVLLNAEAYYDNISTRYFAKKWDKPLTIYYCQKQSDTNKLLIKHGRRREEIGYGVYFSDNAELYTHRFLDDGGGSGWGTLFHEITHHFIHLNFKNPPSWFNEGLACFMGEHARIIKGGLTLGHPNPWREQKLRDITEKRKKMSIKYLTSSTTKQFYKRKDSYHYARSLFYWIYEKGLLDDYLNNVQKNGYDLAVLLRTTDMSTKELNNEWLEFVKKRCYPAAYYNDGLGAKTQEAQQKYYEQSLAIDSSYQPARLELARCYFNEKDYEKCRQHLDIILQKPHMPEYWRVPHLMALSFYKEKNYGDALKCYQKALEYSGYNEYKYEYSYHIGCCYYFLGEKAKATKWFTTFLNECWEPEKRPDWVRYARLYVK